MSDTGNPPGGGVSTGQGRKPRQPRNGKTTNNPITNVRQVDGTVSDSATSQMASPRSKKQPKQQNQNSGNHAHPNNGGRGGGNKQPRPISMSGNHPATPPKEQAYAGPTFQASPAPSSLPVPRFFSRSMPNNAGQPSLQACMEEEKARMGNESSPEPDMVMPVAPRSSNQSPLDMFFNADKQEKSRQNSSSTHLSPQMAARPRPPMTEPRNAFQQSGKNIFLDELNGDSPGGYAPQTMPVNRMRPPMGDRSTSSPGTPQEQQQDVYSRGIKDLLFNNPEASPQGQQTPPRMNGHGSGQQTPSPTQRSASRPETPGRPSSSEQQQHALHYGNRNLSPFFQAATRDETPQRPSSGLRQEVTQDSPFSSSGPMNIPNQSRQGPPQHPNAYAHGHPQQQPMHHPSFQQPAPFPNMFPPGQAQGQNQGQTPPPGYGHPQQQNMPPNMHQGYPPQQQYQQQHYHQQQQAFQQQQAMQHQQHQQGPPPPGGNGSGVQTMEDNLRRMLNLNVQG